MRAAITSISHYAPPEILDNQYFESRLDTSDEWIRSRTGVVERRIARTGGTSDLIAPAARKCLERRGIGADEIDCIVVATVTPDHIFPATAAKVQAKIQAWNAWGFDVSAACCGFLTALIVAVRFVETGAARAVLVCGADKMTTLVDYEDRSSSVLFGDAAGVALVEPCLDETVGVIDHLAWMDGRHAGDLYIPAGGSAKPASHETVNNGEHYLDLAEDGPLVYKAATEGMVGVTQELLRRNELTTDDVRWLVPHQANKRIIEAVGKRVGIDPSRVMCNIDRYGNTSSATIPLCLSEWMESGQLHEKDNVVLTSFGSGFVTGAIFLRWAIPAQRTHPETENLAACALVQA
jgi:3-oxoacyl-[acyl-carrier-protein] synthase III